VWTAVRIGKVKEAAAMLKAIHAQEDAKAAKEKARQVVEKRRRTVAKLKSNDKNNNLPTKKKQKCEKLWTLPDRESDSTMIP
jgi:hypothetical protein